MMYELIRYEADFDLNCGPRPDWDTFFLEQALTYAGRANCTRRKVGAVITRDHQLVAAGYNGAPPGEPGCLTDGACPRGLHYPKPAGSFETVCGSCSTPWPCGKSAPPGEGYDSPGGACTAVHAEVNAIIRAGYNRCRDATMYITDEPCWNCSLAIRAARISRVVIPR